MSLMIILERSPVRLRVLIPLVLMILVFCSWLLHSLGEVGGATKIVEDLERTWSHLLTLVDFSPKRFLSSNLINL